MKHHFTFTGRARSFRIKIPGGIGIITLTEQAPATYEDEIRRGRAIAMGRGLMLILLLESYKKDQIF